MTKTRKTYSTEFKLEVLAMLERGKSAAEIAREQQLSEQTIHNWKYRDRARVLSSEPLPSKAKQAKTISIPVPLAALAPDAIEKWRKSQKPARAAKLLLRGKVRERDAAELMVLLDLQPSDLAPLQRVLILAKQVGMSTDELVTAMIKLVMEKAFSFLKVAP